jgi:hypothetical protein
LPCPEPDVVEAVAEAAVEVAELEAAREEVVQDAVTERNADDNDTREAIAEAQADAAVEIARIEAEAAVEIAQAEADMVATLLEAPELDDEPAEPDVVEAAEQAAESGEATPVMVPPQLEDDAPQRAAPQPQYVSRFRARTQHRR